MPDIPYGCPTWWFNDKFMKVCPCLANIVSLFLLHELISKICLKFQINYVGIESNKAP